MRFKEQLPVIRFLFFALLLYISWYLVYDLWLHPWGRLDKLVIDNSVGVTKFILHLFGYSTFTEQRTVGISGTGGAWIGDPCNGVELFALFTGFILAFPGKLKVKLVFIPAGILSIHFLNILRIVSLLLLQLYHPSMLEFNHTYTFTFLVYTYIFLLWMIFVTVNRKQLSVISEQ